MMDQSRRTMSMENHTNPPKRRLKRGKKKQKTDKDVQNDSVVFPRPLPPALESNLPEELQSYVSNSLDIIKQDGVEDEGIF